MILPFSPHDTHNGPRSGLVVLSIALAKLGTSPLCLLSQKRVVRTKLYRYLHSVYDNAATHFPYLKKQYLT